MEVIRLEALEVGPGPPTEFRIFPFGRIETTKSPFHFDEEAARRVMETWRDYGNDLVIDYEHQTFEPVANGPVPAAGWVKLELRADGLWAVDVRWTPEAERLLKERAYRYFSPTLFQFPEGTVETDRVACLVRQVARARFNSPKER